MTVFLSIPMRGRTQSVLDVARREAEAEICREFANREIKIIDGLIPNRAFDYRRKDVYCLGDAIHKLSEADIAYFASGWSNARGCRIEHMVCELYGIPYVEKIENGQDGGSSEA